MMSTRRLGNQYLNKLASGYGHLLRSSTPNEMLVQVRESNLIELASHLSTDFASVAGADELITSLRNADNPLADFLWRSFSPEERGFFDEHSRSDAIEDKLLNHLNKLIYKDSFYNDERIMQTYPINKNQLSAMPVPLGNRRLLEQVYPEAFPLNKNFYLVTVVANDEREMEDECFKIYYIFSHPDEDLFFTIEYLLGQGVKSYPSINDFFPAVDPFEREIIDLFGLVPKGSRAESVKPGSWLPAPYSTALYPLRRDQSMEQIRMKIEEPLPDEHKEPDRDEPLLENGSFILSVGPVHAGIIEPGRFLFKIAGEMIDDLNIQLGYTHKGIERLFQSNMKLDDGWKLAEQISGDSCVAHSIAYCLAAEKLSDVTPSLEADILRGLFLEMERICNIVGWVAGLVQDMALDLIASELEVIRENLMRLNSDVSTHRFLSRLNRFGGVILPKPLATKSIDETIADCSKEFLRYGSVIKGIPKFRDRAIDVGVLTNSEALEVGATGMIARASGLKRDYRLFHASGIYKEDWMRKLLSENAPVMTTRENNTGDVYARFEVCLQEVEFSTTIIHNLLQRWEKLKRASDTEFINKSQSPQHNNYTFALGHVEGWRGDIIYWLMQDKMNRIYRCKVRDPSMLNWPALRRSVIPREVLGRLVETNIPDFPLINKSFNLSYSGNDL